MSMLEELAEEKMQFDLAFLDADKKSYQGYLEVRCISFPSRSEQTSERQNLRERTNACFQCVSASIEEIVS